MLSAHGISRLLRSWRLRPAILLLPVGLLLGGAHAAAAESKSFVVSFFWDANFSDGKTDCPKGMNPSSIDFYRRELARSGYSHDEIEAALKDFPGEGGLKQPWIPMVATRGNHKDNVYAHPETVPDPGLIEATGPYAYGFNLDGKVSADSYEDPDTHEKGIDNQLYRVMGCIRSYRGLPPPGRPSLPENLWDVLRNVIPAWLVTVTAENGFSKDGPVTVTFDRSLDRITRDAGGAVAQADMTYRVDPDPRSHNVLNGHLRNGVITIDPSRLRLMLDPYEMPELNLTKAHMRMTIAADGSAHILVGGYEPWMGFYYGIADQGHIKEYATSIDIPAVYYALKRNADYDPDPKTGQNRQISCAYFMDAVPAFILPATSARTAQIGAPNAGRAR